MRPLLITWGTLCLMVVTVNGLEYLLPDAEIQNTSPRFQNTYRRQLNVQHNNNQQHYLQAGLELPIPQQDHLQHQQRQHHTYQQTLNRQLQQQQQQNHIQHQHLHQNQNKFVQFLQQPIQSNQQFQRSTQTELQTVPQNSLASAILQQEPHLLPSSSNLDLHHENFLELRNYASSQQLPQRNQQNFDTRQQSKDLPLHAYQQQQLQQSQQQKLTYQQQQPSNQQTKNLPSIVPIPTFQTITQSQMQFNYRQNWPASQQQSGATQQQQVGAIQQQQYQLSPQLGVSPPQIYKNHQSTFPIQPVVVQPLRETYNQQNQQKQVFSEQQHQIMNNAPQTEPADQEYKQKLIQKHEQFVAKQYEKSQHKAQQQHEEFLSKQHAIKQQVLPTIISMHNNSPSQTQFGQTQRGRPVAHPTDYNQFNSALQQYYKEHPTTTTTTTTTTEATSTPKKHNYLQIKSDIGKYESQKLNSKKPIKTISRDDLLKQLKAALSETSSQSIIGNKTYDEMDLVLPNGQRVQVIRTTDPNLVHGQQTYSQEQLQVLLSQQALGAESKQSLSDIAPSKRKDLVLPGGGKVKIQRSPDPLESDTLPAHALHDGVDLSSLAKLYDGNIQEVSPGASSIASSALITSDSDDPPTLEELAKRGLIPDGYEIEGLSSNSAGKSTKAPSTLSPKKKATYVYLEEQSDGGFKIQGVKSNGEKETKQTGAEVESILERIRSGEIKLPPSVYRLTLPNDEIVEIKSGKIIQTTTTNAPQRTPSSSTESATTTAPVTLVTRGTPNNHRQYYPSRILPSPPTATTTSNTNAPYLPFNSSTSTTTATNIPDHTTASSVLNSSALSQSTYIGGPSTHLPVVTDRLSDIILPPDQSTQSALQYADALVQETENTEKAALTGDTSFPLSPSEDLLQILKKNGLFAMSKYLRQSGLDTILNETGPYTIFVPTDKAFKNLLVQLGGPERAEEKFQSNPRLLSGLLLHHVIPGTFEIATLQDEMTGVSLAGTQLRVNQYNMHDQEWNDVTLTTINGAMVVLNKKDIKIPQGVAHAVDRVMFPLPVGDLLQTLQSDREGRFSNFLKILYTSGLFEKLQSKGVKTYTVFAPVDKSFNELDSDTLEKLYIDKELAEQFAMKHIVPGALFSAGMRFYQVKDSLFTGKTVVLQKTSAGKIKVNDAQMVTSNIPATNGVIHALDGVLA